MIKVRTKRVPVDRSTLKALGNGGTKFDQSILSKSRLVTELVARDATGAPILFDTPPLPPEFCREVAVEEKGKTVTKYEILVGQVFFNDSFAKSVGATIVSPFGKISGMILPSGDVSLGGLFANQIPGQYVVGSLESEREVTNEETGETDTAKVQVPVTFIEWKPCAEMMKSAYHSEFLDELDKPEATVEVAEDGVEEEALV